MVCKYQGIVVSVHCSVDDRRMSCRSGTRVCGQLQYLQDITIVIKINQGFWEEFNLHMIRIAYVLTWVLKFHQSTSGVCDLIVGRHIKEIGDFREPES